MKTILPENLVPMDIFEEDFPLQIDLAYARDQAPNIFGQIYHSEARLWLHRGLAQIVLYASRLIEEETGLHLRLYDGLRTAEAQARMQASDVAQANPHWLEEPGRLLSPPGAGAHPRGMAIDLTLQTAEGVLVDMGTVFDHLAENPDAAHNPAHRDYVDLSEEVRAHREILTNTMLKASERLGFDLFPLPQEWWDFRFPLEYYEGYLPLSDADLPPQMRMTDEPFLKRYEDLPLGHFTALKAELSKLEQ